MTNFGDSTATDWDAAQSESFVHHEQPANTDWAAADTVELGLPTHDTGGTSLAAYWPFDEDSGTTAYDVSGNARDGSISGAAVGQPGIRGTTAYSSDGVDDYITTNWAGVSGSTNRTFECWIKTSTGADQSLINYGDQTTNGEKWLVRIDEATTAGDWTLRVEVGGGFVRGTTHIADGQWHHVACVLNGSDCTDHTLYVDGTAETVDASSAQAVNSDVTAADVWFFHRPTTWSGSGGRVFNGLMDEPRFYTRALSAAEIQTHAHGDTPTGSLRTATKTVADAAPPAKLTTSSSLAGGSIDVVVYEDTNQDGIADHSQLISLAGGTDETNSLSGFSGGTNVDYWVKIRGSVPNPTATAPTLDSYSVVSTASIALPVTGLTATTPASTVSPGTATPALPSTVLGLATPAPSVGFTLDAPATGLTATTSAPAVNGGATSISPRATALDLRTRGISLVAGYSRVATPATTLSATASPPTASGGASSLSSPTATLTATTPTPSLASGTVTVAPPVTGLTTTAPAPDLTVGYVIPIPAAPLTTTSPAPSLTGGPTTLSSPTTLLTASTPPPSMTGVTSVSPPVALLTTTTPTPTTAVGESPVTPPSVDLSVTGVPVTFAAGGTTAAPPAATLTTQAVAPARVSVVGYLVQRADPITATVAWEADQIEATTAWIADQIISDIHTD